MFVETVVIPEYVLPNGKIWKNKQLAKLVCDFCKCEYFVVKPANHKKKSHHYCSKACSNKDPARKERQRKSNVETYAIKGDEIAEKVKKTFNEHYGVDYFSQTSDWKEKVEHTSYEKFGVANAAQSEDVKKRMQETCIERYGVSHYLKSDELRGILKKGNADGNTAKKYKETSLKNYNVDHASQSEVVQKRMQTTCLERYGVKSTLLLPETVRKARIASVTEEASQKRHATMKRNGTYRTSKPEERCFELLTSMFQNVERQKRIKRWAIDFYVRDINTYIQFDGSYWHGLDRSLEEIALHKNVRDVQIHKKVLTDQKQNEYFRDVGMKLVRLSEKDIVDIETLKRKLNSQD